jgi:hypothetical protein
MQELNAIICSTRRVFPFGDLQIIYARIADQSLQILQSIADLIVKKF